MKPKRKNKPGQGRKAEGRVGKMIYMRPEAWRALDNQHANIGDTRGKVVERLLGVPDHQNQD